MKRTPISTTLLGLGSGTLALGLIACASSGPSRSAKAVERMDETHAGLTRVRSQIDQTLTSSADVMKAEALTVANEAFDPFLNNLGDVQKVFGNDLTPAGQSLVANTAVVQGANDKGARVAQSIDVALVALSNVSGQLSSGAKK